MIFPEWVISEIRALPEQFTGSITVNCFKGGVSNITVTASIKSSEATNALTVTA